LILNAQKSNLEHVGRILAVICSYSKCLKFLFGICDYHSKLLHLTQFEDFEKEMRFVLGSQNQGLSISIKWQKLAIEVE
jgi:hypothetical protein